MGIYRNLRRKGKRQFVIEIGFTFDLFVNKKMDHIYLASWVEFFLATIKISAM